MEKRLPLAFFLSAIVLAVWMGFFAPERPVPPVDGPDAAAAGSANAGVETVSGAPASANPQAAPTLAAVEPPAVPEALIGAEVFESDSFVVGRAGESGYFRASFSNRGGTLDALLFGGYFVRVGLTDAERELAENWLPLVAAIEPVNAAPTGSFRLTNAYPSSRDLAPRGLDTVLWRMERIVGEDGAPLGMLFTYGPGNGLVFTKRITFEPGTWHVRFELGIANEGSDATGTTTLGLIPASCVPPELGDNFYTEPRAVVVEAGADEAEWKAAPGLSEADAFQLATTIACAGVHNKYFALLMREDDGTSGTMVGARYAPIEETGTLLPDGTLLKRDLIENEIQLKLRVPESGRANTWNYTVYAGPKSPDAFVQDFAPHQFVLDSDLGGFCGISFTSIGHGLLWVLRKLHAVTMNWGVSIILLTLFVRLALFPINRRSQTAMARYQKKMKRVQPRLDEIKKKYEDDPKKLREAQAKIMQEEGAFPPLGGCLPMFLQLPVFFGLFSMLRTSFDLRHQPFYAWITDLSRPDRLLEIDLTLPLLGNIQYFNLLPILMVIMWIVQQKGMPQPTDEQAKRMQKMMTFMPIVFGFMLYNYAAGLSLYMLTTSTLGIFEQQVIKKVWPIDDNERDKPTKKKGCGPFSGFMEQLAEKQKEQMKRAEAMRSEQKRQSGKKKKRR